MPASLHRTNRHPCSQNGETFKFFSKNVRMFLSRLARRREFENSVFGSLLKRCCRFGASRYSSSLKLVRSLIETYAMDFGHTSPPFPSSPPHSTRGAFMSRYVYEWMNPGPGICRYSTKT